MQAHRPFCPSIVCQSQKAEAYIATDKTTLKRYAKRAEYDRKVVHAILDEVRLNALEGASS